MIVKLLIEHHLEFLSIKGGCPGSSKSTHVKMPHCWKSHVLAQIIKVIIIGRCCHDCHSFFFVTYLYLRNRFVLLDFSLTVKAAPHECVIRTSQP